VALLSTRWPLATVDRGRGSASPRRELRSWCRRPAPGRVAWPGRLTGWDGAPPAPGHVGGSVGGGGRLRGAPPLLAWDAAAIRELHPPARWLRRRGSSTPAGLRARLTPGCSGSGGAPPGGAQPCIVFSRGPVEQMEHSEVRGRARMEK
jgi:hypothetical protein